jgi:hypothetical protein
MVTQARNSFCEWRASGAKASEVEDPHEMLERVELRGYDIAHLTSS